MTKKRFSKRLGYSEKPKPIVTRDEAPEGLRDFVYMSLLGLGIQPSGIRKIICNVLRKAPDPNNWSEFPNINDEALSLIREASWYKIYDIIEEIWEKFDRAKRTQFEGEINEFFNENGIGWKFHKGQIEFRGDETFEANISKATEVLKKAHIKTARTKIEEAIHDLSRRPNPDITGAIQHASASLECLAREVAGDQKKTLGELIRKHPDIVPRPLNEVVSKIWGFSSEQGRHLKEGNPPSYAEAELMVGLCTSLVVYLANRKIEDANDQEFDLF